MSAVLVPNRLLPQMVSRTYYEEEEPQFRRYSSRGHGYPLSHDREPLPSGPNHNVYSRPPHPSNQESRHRNRSPDQDEIPRTRSRIPVACGRCRKRKIRCSGDSGNGGPCTNCKSAGSDQCAFLRVSSQETPFKMDSSNFELDGGSAGSRVNCRMVPFGPHSYPHGSSLPLDSYPARNNSLSTYPYGGLKNYYPLPAYSDMEDDSVDYGLHQFQLLPGDQLGLGGSYTPAPSRPWASTPQLMKSLPFLDPPTPLYNHGHPSYNGSNFDMRSNITPPDMKPLHLGGMNSSIPGPINTGMDRLLPFPVNAPASRPPQATQYLPPADSLLPGANSRGSYIDYGMVQTLKVQNSNSVADNSSLSTSSYAPLVHNSPGSLDSNSSQPVYTPPPNSDLPPSQADIYTPPSVQNEPLPNASENYNSSSFPESDSGGGGGCGGGSYIHRGSSVSDPKRNGSVSSQGYSHDGLPPNSRMTTGLLANGQQYYPAPSSHGSNSYPAPPIEMHPQPRRQSGVIA